MASITVQTLARVLWSYLSVNVERKKYFNASVEEAEGEYQAALIPRRVGLP